ncbi:MAG: hypothetical protein LBL35_05810 [Clostridiales bacterium]|jgi:hypothetical protein|nr:hypothetical protein [Clostridiales bacterium]
MAKKDKRVPEEKLEDGAIKEVKPKKKRKKRVLASVITLSLLGVFLAVVVFNPLNIRRRYITPVARRIPLIKNFTEVDDAGLTRAELEATIASLETELEGERRLNDEMTEKSGQYVKEISRLKDIEARQAKFQVEKEKFDAMIVQGDPKAYVEFYESVLPENAEELYENAVSDISRDREFKKYINALREADEEASAKILETLAAGDMELVVDILRGFDAEKCGSILSAMETGTAADVVRNMSPI